MEDYNLHQNQNHPPCNFQEIMELCSVPVSTYPPITVGPDNRCLVNDSVRTTVSPDNRRLLKDSVTDWRRSFVVGCRREDEEGGRAVQLPPFSKIGGGEMNSGGDGAENVDGRNPEQILYGRNIEPNMDPRKLKR